MIDSTSALPFFAALDDAGVLGFDGADVATFLQGQLSSDVAALAVGDAQWASYNSPKGRMLGSLLLWREGPQSYRAWVAADLAEALRKRLAMFVLRAKVAVTERTAHGPRLGVGGEPATAAIAAAFGDAPAPGHVLQGDGAMLVATPDGRVLIHASADAANAVRQRLAAQIPESSAARWDLAGIRAGVPWVTLATQDLFVPQNLNWDLVGGVNFQKGCYPGQEIVARMHYLGRLKERTLRFGVETSPPLPGTRLYGDVFGEQSCGTVVNAAATGNGGGSELLAVVRWDALDASPLRLGALEGPALTRLDLPYAVPVPAAPSRPTL